MRVQKKMFLLGCVLTLLSACTTLQPSGQQITKPAISAQTRDAQLSALSTWNISGAVAVNKQNKGWSASMRWQQNLRDNYQFQLFGPLGIGSINIIGTAKQVRLVNNNKQTLTASNAENLLLEQVGWHVPFANLYYWVRGIPVPGLQNSAQRDAQNRITSLEQASWKIQYLDFISVKGLDLPRKIEFSSQDLRTRMVIKSWSF